MLCTIMEWADDAIVLSARSQGEGSLILALLTRGHGRHKGLVRGGARSRQRGLYEPGNRVRAHWQARLAEHLGHLHLESLGVTAALILDDPLRLGCLEAAAALADAALPERAPHPAVYDAFARLLDRLVADDGYGAAHLGLELAVLAELGYGLDLASCAVTGTAADLAYVSPRTGRAVSREAGAAYRDRLLVLPRLLGGLGSAAGDARDLLDGLDLTAAFLERDALGGKALPPARSRYRDRLARLALPPTG